MHRLLALVVALTALAALAVPAPVAAQQPPPFAGELVWPGLRREPRLVGLPGDARAVANILHWDVADPTLELRPVLANGTIRGLETVPSMGKRLLAEGAVAGVNGGFWQQLPLGDPNGYYAVDGELISNAESQGEGPRGMFGVTRDGDVLMTRVDTKLTLALPEGESLPVRALNRFKRPATDPFPDGDDAAFVYTSWIGDSVLVPPDPTPAPPPTPEASESGSESPTQTPTPSEPPDEITPARVLVLDGLRPPSSGTASGRVSQVLDGGGRTLDIPDDGAVVVAQDDSAEALAGVAVGDEVALEVTLDPFFSNDDAEAWNTITMGLAVGPLVVHQRGPVPPGNWLSEGFAPEVHSNVRHPRSAIAITEEGRMLLVTIDGRQPGYSAGMTLEELTGWLLSIGAVSALSLDGGGSTQMVVDGILRNSACCDRPLRPVANALFVHHEYRFEATDRLMGFGREATAAAVAAASHPDGAAEVVLANGAAFPDALAGGPLARALDAPLLLVGKDAVPEPTASALARLSPQRVTILGGTGVVSQAVEDELRTLFDVRRLSGRDRTETAAAIAALVGAAHRRVFLASGERFPDALSAAAPAGILRMPILLSRRDDLPLATADALLAAGAEEVVVVGGEGVVGQPVVEALEDLGMAVSRLAGSGRYGTASAVNEWAVEQDSTIDASTLVVASGDGFPDALAGGPLAAQRHQLLMIVPAGSVYADRDAEAYLEGRLVLNRVTLLGGYAALSTYQQWQLDQLAQRIAPADPGAVPPPAPTEPVPESSTEASSLPDLVVAEVTEPLS